LDAKEVIAVEQPPGADGVQIAVLREGRAGLTLIRAAAHAKRYKVAGILLVPLLERKHYRNLVRFAHNWNNGTME